MTKKDRVRKYREKVTKGNYKPFIDEQGVSPLSTICFYCGDMATGVDHVIPITFLYSLKQVGIERHSTTVPCCIGCNRLLGDSVFDTVEEKREYLLSTIKRKYKRVLQFADWKQDEIDEMGYNLRKSIQKLTDLKKNTLKRIETIQKSIK